MADQLKTELRVQAWLRRFVVTGLMATVARRGDREGGALFLKVNRFRDGCVVYSGISTPLGTPAWIQATGPNPVSEKDADAYLARQAQYDADLWIVEVEDPKGLFEMDEPVTDV